MDILVIKAPTGIVNVEQLNYATFNSRPTYAGGEQITFMDKVKHIIEEKAKLKIYKIGIAQDWVEADGHGGGDYWEKISNSQVDELDKMVNDHTFTPNELVKITKIKEERSNKQYSYVIPYKDKESTEWEFMLSEDPTHINNPEDNIPYKELFVKALNNTNSEIGVYYNIGNYSLERIRNTPLLSEVNMDELISVLTSSSHKLDLQKVTLSQISNARELIRGSSQYFKHKSNPDFNHIESAKGGYKSVVEQYQELKSQSRADEVLLMQCGKFYNAFGEDAKKISEVAKVKLIVKKPENIPMIGIPVDKFEGKFKKMLTGGGLSLAVSNVVDKHFNREVAKYAAIPQPETEPPSQGFTHD